MAETWDYDVAVVGGGPGGSAAAAALARRGRSVLILEREEFPRFHIGESLLPWSNDVFKELGAEDVVAKAGFVQKWGASFCLHDGTIERYADFSSAVEVRQAQTYQVPRDSFDRLLLDHAVACGAAHIQGRAQEAAFDEAGVTLAYHDAAGDTRRLRVGAVVDASGRAGFLARRFGRREFDPKLRNIAVHAQYEGIPRLEGRRAGDIRLLTRPDGGWVWLIPLDEARISVGVVLPQAVHNHAAKATPEASLEHYLSEMPRAVELLQKARRVSPARFDADYSYVASEHAGDRWLLVGDAGAFLDPIFSTGVQLAMQAGLDAAQAIDAGLAKGDLGRRQFVRFEKRVLRRYRHFRRFAVGFYDPAFRDLWFSGPPTADSLVNVSGAHASPFARPAVFRAVLSVLAGNWRPTLLTRFKLAYFFMLVWIQRRFALVPRHHAFLIPEEASGR